MRPHDFETRFPFSRHGASRGFDFSKKDFAFFGGQSSIDDKSLVAASINDDLALSRKIRDATALSLEKITYDDRIPATVKARSLAALATTLKLTQNVQRCALNLDKSNPFEASENLPTLTVLKMTETEIEAIQRKLINDEQNLSEESSYH